MKDYRLWLVVVVGIFLFAACGPGDTGTLQGKVSLVPVVSAGEVPPTPSPAEFAARQIVVKEGNGLTEVMRADLDPEGNYSVVLLEGLYTIDITHDGPEGTSGLPKQIQITPGEVTELDVTVQISDGG